MTEENIDKLIARALEEDLQLPEGLSERLERKIDLFEDKGKSNGRKRFVDWRFFSGIAASVAVVAWIITVSFQHNHTAGYMDDTFDDPEEAAAYVAQTLQVISKSINKGVDPAVTNLNKTKKIDQTLNYILKQP